MPTFARILICVLLAATGPVWATAGTISEVTGKATVRHADGRSEAAVQRLEVQPGDDIATERDTTVRIEFTDGSSMTVRPNSTVTIEAYNFVQAQPAQDSLSVRLLKGGLRTLTGLVGKRGNEDAYRIRTSAATIGIRGSEGDTLECSQGCEDATPTSGKLEAGAYHATYTGAYVLFNDAGSVLVRPGQIGYAKDFNTPPRLLPSDPGLGLPGLPPGKLPPSSGITANECSVM